MRHPNYANVHTAADRKLEFLLWEMLPDDKSKSMLVIALVFLDRCGTNQLSLNALKSFKCKEIIY